MAKKQHYMLVDDDPTNNLICKLIIKKVDPEADINMFTNPEKALASIGKEFDTTNQERQVILFLDINMPTMTGWEFLDAFIQFEKLVKDQFVIYILSSSIKDFTEESTIYPIVKGFISKPLKFEILEEIKKNLLIHSFIK